MKKKVYIYFSVPSLFSLCYTWKLKSKEREKKRKRMVVALLLRWHCLISLLNNLHREQSERCRERKERERKRHVVIKSVRRRRRSVQRPLWLPVTCWTLQPLLTSYVGRSVYLISLAFSGFVWFCFFSLIFRRLLTGTARI